MAKFTDQFIRHNPRKFKPSMLAPTWPPLLMQDALGLLKEFTDDELVQIAQAVESEIQGHANPATFPTSKDHWIWTRVKAHWVTHDFNTSPEKLRENFGDLNIYLAFHKDGDFFGPSELRAKVKNWHLLAALSVWKLIDSCELLWGHTTEWYDSGRNYIDPKMVSATVTGIAMEAQAAIGVALLRLEESRGRTHTAKKAVDKRNRQLYIHQDEALRIANSRPFELKKSAVIFIQESLVKGYTKDGTPVRYNKAVISRWLTKGNWKPSKVAKPKR